MIDFGNLNKNMTNAINKLIESQNLCKYLYYNQDNPLSQPPIDDTYTLLGDKIIPANKSNNITTDEKSQIYIYFDGFQPSTGQRFIANNLIIDVFVHENLLLLDGEDFLRLYCIMHEIGKIFNGQNVGGLGKLEFLGGQVIDGVDNHDAVRMIYKIVDFA